MPAPEGTPGLRGQLNATGPLAYLVASSAITGPAEELEEGTNMRAEDAQE